MDKNVKELATLLCPELNNTKEIIDYLENLELLFIDIQTTLPRDLSFLKKVRQVSIGLEYAKCSLEEFFNSLKTLPNLTERLSIDLDPKKKNVIPNTLGEFTKLKSLKIHCYDDWCKEYNDILELPPNLGNLVNLESLIIVGGTSLKKLPELGNFKKLKTLCLNACESLETLPESIGELTNLEWLEIDFAHSLKTIPQSFANLTNLKYLVIGGCSPYLQFPKEVGNFKKLEQLYISGFSTMTEFPIELTQLINLKVLWIYPSFPDEFACDDEGSFCPIKTLPEEIGNLTNLTDLDLYSCIALEELPEGICNLSNLENLELSHELSVLKKLPNNLHKLKKLKNLELPYGLDKKELKKVPNYVEVSTEP